MKATAKKVFGFVLGFVMVLGLAVPVAANPHTIEVGGGIEVTLGDFIMETTERLRHSHGPGPGEISEAEYTTVYWIPSSGTEITVRGLDLDDDTLLLLGAYVILGAYGYMLGEDLRIHGHGDYFDDDVYYTMYFDSWGWDWDKLPDGTVRGNILPSQGRGVTRLRFDGTSYFFHIARYQGDTPTQPAPEPEPVQYTPTPEIPAPEPAPLPTPPAEGVTILLNGSPMSFDVPPEIINNRTMVPLRAIFEAMGAAVEWDGETQTATATRGSTVVILPVGSYEPTIPGVIVDNRTLAPLRFVAEAFGGTVEWDGETQTARISAN